MMPAALGARESGALVVAGLSVLGEAGRCGAVLLVGGVGAAVGVPPCAAGRWPCRAWPRVGRTAGDAAGVVDGKGLPRRRAVGAACSFPRTGEAASAAGLNPVRQRASPLEATAAGGGSGDR